MKIGSPVTPAIGRPGQSIVDQRVSQVREGTEMAPKLQPNDEPPTGDSTHAAPKADSEKPTETATESGSSSE
jgi:hypothetical protein